ncbi:MAG: PIG-L family deacetylase [Chloroflexota bacterium]
MTEQKTLLALFAHPDDESFGPGGTLARYAAEGVAVHVIIATDGIAGSVEEDMQAHVNGDGGDEQPNLAEIRAEELVNATKALGVTGLWSLGYRDSGMRNTPDNEHPKALVQQPLDRLTSEIGEYIQRFQPEVVLTHDPYGGYGHPDHVRLCEATTAAFYMARYQATDDESYMPQKLYYTSFSRSLLRLIVRVMRLVGQDPTAVGRNKDINLVEISQWETPTHAKINVKPYLDAKDVASRAHASQYSGGPSYLQIIPKRMRRSVTRLLLGMESFMRAYPAPTSKIEQDLFEGVA